MGVLKGITVLELGGIGPVPFCGMLLADMGARVIRVERRGGALLQIPDDPTRRHRESIALNLKDPRGIEIITRLLPKVDLLLEGFRPHVMTKLGLDPSVLLDTHPRLIIGRMTGWGQNGMRSQTAGHDLNYLSLSGLLNAIGTAGAEPVPPLNLVADYGGGAMMLALSALAAIIERNQSGKGQIIDAAMCDGVTMLGSVFYAMKRHQLWSETRQDNLLDGGAPFYRTYRTSDDRYLAVACLEPQFYQIFLDRVGLAEASLPAQYDRSRWDELAERFEATIRTKTRDEWTRLFSGTDACVTPVNSLSEAASDAHYVSRNTFENVEGFAQPIGLPKFSRTPNKRPKAPPKVGEHGTDILQTLGFSPEDIESLRQDKVLS